MWNVLLIVCAAYAVYFEKNPKPGPGLTSVPSFIISGALDPGFDGHWTQTGEFDFGFPVYRLDETTGNSIGSSVTDSPVVYSSQSLPEGLQAPAASSDFHVVPTYALPSEIEQSQIIPSEEVSTQPIPSDTSGKFIYPYKMPDTTIHYIFDSDVDYSNGIFGGMPIHSCDMLPNVRVLGPEMWGGNVGKSTDRHVFYNNPKMTITPDGMTLSEVQAQEAAACPSVTEKIHESEMAMTPFPTPEATPSPTPEATHSPTPEATPSPTPEATSPPTPEATPSPTPEATPSPTPEATPSPTPKATPSPTPEPPMRPMSVNPVSLPKLSLGVTTAKPATPKSSKLGAGYVVLIVCGGLVGCVMFMGLFVRPRKREDDEVAMPPMQ
jgi:hypothetical protein